MTLPKFNWSKIIIVMMISLGLLFSGWYLHQTFQVVKPMTETLETIQGVSVNDIDISNKKLDIKVTLGNVDNFQDTYNQIEKKVKPYLHNRNLQISIENKGNKQMNDAWKQSYFSIAEAVDQHHYSLIPNTVNGIKQKIQLDRVGYSMDDNRIYVDLHRGKSSLFFVIPKNDPSLVVNS